MNTELQIFKNEEFGEVRTVEENGQIYFCGSDVAKALGYAKPSQAVIDHCKGIRKLGIPSAGGIQETNFILESDLYRLIIKAADQSRNPDIKEIAEKFEKWVFDEVLPTIRKTGSYNKPISMEDIMIYQLESIKVIKQRQIEQQQQLDTVTTRLDGMKEVIQLNTTEWRNTCQKIIIRISEKMGGHHYIPIVHTDIYELLDLRAGCDLKTRLRNRRHRMADSGVCKSQCGKVTTLDVIADDKKLIEIYVAIVKEMALKYGIELPDDIAINNCNGVEEVA